MERPDSFDKISYQKAMPSWHHIRIIIWLVILNGATVDRQFGMLAHESEVTSPRKWLV